METIFSSCSTHLVLNEVISCSTLDSEQTFEPRSAQNNVLIITHPNPRLIPRENGTIEGERENISVGAIGMQRRALHLGRWMQGDIQMQCLHLHIN
jgi:hypothetical protein